MFYNEEKLRPERPAKFFVALGLTIISILYRVFLTSILFAITPFWILGIGIVVYFINVTVNKATGNTHNSKYLYNLSQFISLVSFFILILIFVLSNYF
jgi:hypothetical protein